MNSFVQKYSCLLVNEFVNKSIKIRKLCFNFVNLLGMCLRKVWLSVFLLVVLISCEDEKVPTPVTTVSKLKLTLQPTYGSADLLLDQTIVSPEGYLVQFTDIKCYFSDFKNGSNQLFQAALYDFRETGTFVCNVNGKPGDFQSLNGSLGVISEINHNDPSAFPNDSPLNIANANDMHWDWNPGYIFMKIEAKVDTIPDAVDNFDHTVVFHVGTDINLQSLSFSSLNWIAVDANNHSLALKLDLEKFLQNGSQTIDLKTEYSSHTAAGEEALSLKVIQNFKDAISLF